MDGRMMFAVSSMWIICRAHTFIFALAKVKVGTTSQRNYWKIVPNSQRPTLLKVSCYSKAPSLRRYSFSNTYTIMISGNKKDNIAVIYTPWSNLLKTASMATGQVSFHNPKLTRKMFVPARQNPIVNRLNKTKVEKYPDLRAEKEEYLAKIRKEERKRTEERRAANKKERKEREELKWQKDHAYDDLMSEENIQQSSNVNRDESYLDDFM
ncbi:hypothetical protein PRK78_001067 [Emydomyces testavorans]|uniref:NFACT RNA-binding domain-containing protein n=1 Tax=Emydomyces testavorans TaxID=2070801 RepID=A0AAF0DBW3_9EURO|nr:hypothetical protein PRK78_001067 [Emydomyces testavorans]